MLSWRPSIALRAACAVRAAIGVGACYLILRMVFPHVLLVPVLSVAGAVAVAQVLALSRVQLDAGRGEVGLAFGWWTRHVPLTQIKSVDQIFRFGAEITAGRVSYRYAAFRKPRGWLERHLHVRTGFEGMELAITQAAAVARAEAGLTAPADPSSAPSYPLALLCFLTGFAFAGVALLVQPQTGETVVHVFATLMIIWLSIGATISALFGTGLLVSRIRRRGTRSLA